jgi:TatD DNase family protein
MPIFGICSKQIANIGAFGILKPMKYIDTHAHLNLQQFDADRTAVIATCQEEEVAVINVGTRQATSQLAVDLAHKHENLWAIVGVHPCSVVDTDPDDHGATEAEPVFDYDFYNVLANDPKTVGIGECGFDYCHNPEDTYELQREVFLDQIELANEVGKPLMLHLRNNPKGGTRDAYDDALEILKTESNVSGNAHFYAGTIEQAKTFFDIGYTISFTGVVTFPAHKPGIEQYLEVVRYAPLDMIHAETDCPYVAPVPHRGQRCEPWMVQEVYKSIAQIKGKDEEQVREQLLANAKRMYSLQ